MAETDVFDKKTLLALESKEQRYRIQDPKTPGLNLVVHPTGRKTWSVIKRPHGGKPISRFIGTFPDLSISLARAKAAEELGVIAVGRNLNSEAREQQLMERQQQEANITLAGAWRKVGHQKNV